VGGVGVAGLEGARLLAQELELDARLEQGGDEGAVAEVAVVRVVHLRLHVHLHLVEGGAATGSFNANK